MIEHEAMMIPLGTYMPASFHIDPLDMACTICGRPVREHRMGGPGPSCPVKRTPLWAWNDE